MPIENIQQRRNKAHTMAYTQTEENKYEQKMHGSILRKLGRITVKKLFLGIIFVIVFFKLWQLFSTPAPKDFPPPDAKVEPPQWRYKDNPQGTSEDRLKRLLSSIKSGEGFWFQRPEDEGEKAKATKALHQPVPTVQSTYKSTGSLTFKDGHFYLDGKQFRILSGAMHYFRVVPEYWADRMRKMKACGLNTLET